VQQSLNGNSVILENREGEESNLNLELLFNAMLTNREKMTEIINK
ncbi:MAG: ABC transporter ATP-binding protein, partial [Candidatus Limisoma sp.]|nr:ABC transporter ATP-binding protein [Bacteroidales bacterium]MDY5893651.1 ABC transporter ATP-binding protein [Candidatus Limisoma sp.]